MPSAKVDIDIARLIQIQSGIESAMNEGLISAGTMVKELAASFAPKDTGDLSNSGDSKLVAPRLVEVSFGNGLGDNRAVVQEFGSVFMPAQPYLTPALRAIDVGLEVQKALKKKF